MRRGGFAAVLGMLALVCSTLLADVFMARQRDVGPMRELVAALGTQSTRPVEGRLAGVDRYAPPPVQTRGVTRAGISPEMQIAVATLEKQLGTAPTIRGTAALGVAYLALHQWTKAVDALEEAVRREPTNAAFLNDLSAAYQARATAESRPEDWVSALAAAERSIAADGRRADAHFNRALALGGLHLTYEEIEEWKSYEAMETSAPWVMEAQRRLALATRPAAEGDGIVDLGPDRVRIEDDLLTRWGIAYESGRVTEAAALLAEAETQATHLAQAGGDTMPRDEVAIIRRAENRGGVTDVRSLARGHRLFGLARERFLSNDIVPSARLMSEASDAFSRVLSPYRHWAAVYDAIAIRNEGRSEAAVERLARIDKALVPTYAYLRARVAWTEALARTSLGRYDVARDLLISALAVLGSAREVDNAIPVRTILAEMEWYLGKHASAWSTLRGVLAAVDDRSPTSRVQHFDLAATMAMGHGLPEAALAFQGALIRLAPSPSIRAEAYLRRARTYIRLKNAAAAEEDLARAIESLPATLDAPQRNRLIADVAAARADLLTDRDCTRAITESAKALAYYEQVAGTMRRVAVLTGRAKCRAILGDRPGARADLLAAIEFFEQRRSSITGAADRVQAFELERRAFSDLLALDARAHDEAAAFATAERSRAGVIAEHWKSPRQAAADYTALPPGVAVVYYEALPERVLVWVLTRDRRVSFERPLAEATLSRMVSRTRAGIEQGADLVALRAVSAELFDALIAPALALADELGFKPTIVFVPAGPLYALPFAALPDANGRALLEDRTITLAPSLRTLVSASSSLAGAAVHSVVAVGDGHDPEATGLPMLPMADAEAKAVGAAYPARTVLVGAGATRQRFLDARADVIHFAGHSVLDERYPMLSRMLLAPDAATGDSGWVIESDITAQRFAGTRVVMLATCESAAGRPVQGEGAISMARAFFAAGVPAVVASLWPVDDDLQTLVGTFHRTLRDERDPAQALRAGQLALLRERGRRAPVRVWGGFIMLGGVIAPPPRG
jgi:CHAT domain-containing protein/tetratricopeptide (TPR) repeat protein